jgi:hypothetical protein
VTWFTDRFLLAFDTLITMTAPTTFRTVAVAPDPVRDARDYLNQLIRERACGSQIRRAKLALRDAVIAELNGC